MILRKDCDHFLETINEKLELFQIAESCFYGLCPLLQLCFSSLLTPYELYCCCPIVSIDFTVSTTVIGIISLLFNTKKSRLSSVKGFPISSMTEVKDMTSFAKARCVLGVCLWCRVSPVCGV